MSFRSSTVTGLAWTTVLRGAVRVANFIKTAILARLLLPAQFGAFGVASLYLSLLEILTETGINVFLLQEKGPLDEYVDTAWIISIVRGIIISLLMVVSAPVVVGFFHIPAAQSLIYLSAIIPFLRGFINPSSVKFLKDLRFDKEFYYRFGLTIIETVVMVGVGLYTHSASSFVWGLIVAAVFEVLLSHLFIFPRPHLQVKMPILKSILHRGKWVTGFVFFDYLFTTGDNIVVGRLLGDAALGLYQNAYKISTIPLDEIITIFHKVTFPAYVEISDNSHHLRKSVLKAIGLNLIFITCMSFVVFLLAYPLVSIVLGPNWLATVPLVRILALLGLAKGISYSFNSLFLTVKRQHYVTFVTAASVVGMGAIIIPLVNRYGILGAGIAATFGAVVSTPVAIGLAIKTFRLLEERPQNNEQI